MTFSSEMNKPAVRSFERLVSERELVSLLSNDLDEAYQAYVEFQTELVSAFELPHTGYYQCCSFEAYQYMIRNKGCKQILLAC